MPDWREISTSLKNTLPRSNIGLALPQLADANSSGIVKFLMKETLVDLVIKGGSLAIDFVKSLSIWEKMGTFFSDFGNKLKTPINKLIQSGKSLKAPTATALDLLKNPEDSNFLAKYKSLVPLDELTTAASSAVSASEIFRDLRRNAKSINIDKIDLSPLADKLRTDMRISDAKINQAVLDKVSPETMNKLIAQDRAIKSEFSEALKDFIDYKPNSAIADASNTFDKLIDEIGVKGATKLALGGIFKALPAVNLVAALSTKDVTFILNPFASIINIFVKPGHLPNIQPYIVNDDKTAVGITQGLVQLEKDLRSGKLGQKFFQRVTDKQIANFNNQINFLVTNSFIRLEQLSTSAITQFRELQTALVFTEGILNSRDTTLNDADRLTFGNSILNLKKIINIITQDIKDMNSYDYTPIREELFDRNNVWDTSTGTWYANKIKPVTDFIAKIWVDLERFSIAFPEIAKISSTINKNFLIITQKKLDIQGEAGKLTIIDNPVKRISSVSQILTFNPYIKSLLSPTYDRVINPPISNVINPSEKGVLNPAETLTPTLTGTPSGVRTRTRARTISATRTISKTATRTEKEPVSKTKTKRRKKRGRRIKEIRKRKIPELIVFIQANVSSRSEWIQNVQFKFFRPAEQTSNAYGRLWITTKKGKTYYMGNFRRGTFSWISTYGVGTGFGFWSQLPKKRAILTGTTFSAEIKKINKAERLQAIDKELITPRITYK